MAPIPLPSFHAKSGGVELKLQPVRLQSTQNTAVWWILYKTAGYKSELDCKTKANKTIGIT